jgi:hypothetical protein
MITILDIVFHAAFVATCTNEQPAFAIEPLNTPFVHPLKYKTQRSLTGL